MSVFFGTFAARIGAKFSARGVRSLARAAAMIVAAAVALPTGAQTQPDDDLPGRVGRIADFAGQLFLAPQESATQWSPVGVNYPVTTGDNLWVSGDGRAEVDYGGGQFRLAGDTNLHVSRLDERQLALFVERGRLIVRVRVLDAGDAARVDTPNTQVALTRPGLYRIDVSADRQATTVTVREGEALVAVASGAQQALPGQTLTVAGPDPAQAEFLARAGIDGFDSWSADRDRRYERGASAAFVSRQMVGVAELDEYGYWENNATYGPVWYPTAVAPDWAPYRFGYWTSVGDWGLTWVDAAPWGYAPSHYGRWVRIGPRWGWCPGAQVARPHWAPALVGWVGGAGWGVAVSGGSPVYGWVPLGWGDAYHPWWRRCSDNCWTRYNRPYAVSVNVRPSAPPPRYANAAVQGALTAVAAPALGSRKPVSQSMVPLPSSYARAAPVLATAPPVAPAHVPGVRPGERGTPVPASSQPPRTWQGRDGRDRGGRPTAAPGAAPAPPLASQAAPQQAAPAAPRVGPGSVPAVPAAPQFAPAPAQAPAVAAPSTAPGARESRRVPPAASAPHPGGTPPATPAAAGAGHPLPPPPSSVGSVAGAPPSVGAQGPSAGVQPPTAPMQTPPVTHGRRGGAGPAGQPTGSPPAGASAGATVPQVGAAPAPPGAPVAATRSAPHPSAGARGGAPSATSAPAVPAPSGRAGPALPVAAPPAAPSPSGRAGAAAAPPSAPRAPVATSVPQAPAGAPAAAPAPATQHVPQGRAHGTTPTGATSDGGKDPGGNTARK